MMETYKLVSPSYEHEKQYEEMMIEWESYKDPDGYDSGCLSRYSYSQHRVLTYIEWLNDINQKRERGKEIYFFIKNSDLLGAINIRLNQPPTHSPLSGHIGYSIRPSQRRKGYATKMLSLLLPQIKEYGINPITITCDKKNIGSAKTILNNGGILIDEITSERTGNIIQMYHIFL